MNITFLFLFKSINKKFKLKCCISKLALAETTLKALSEPLSYVWNKIISQKKISFCQWDWLKIFYSNHMFFVLIWDENLEGVEKFSPLKLMLFRKHYLSHKMKESNKLKQYRCHQPVGKTIQKVPTIWVKYGVQT